MASSHNQKKDNNKFKNEKYQEFSENTTVWQSNNQGVKEETLSRPIGGVEKTPWKVGAGRPTEAAAGGLGIHINMQINLEEQMGSEIDHANQNSSVGK